MLCSKNISGAKITAPEPIGDWSIAVARESENEELTRVASRPFRAIAIVEPRLKRAGESTSNSNSTTTSSSNDSEWFMLPHSIEADNDVMRLISSLSSVVQILSRMTNAAAQELRQHPERDEAFQGLRMLLDYADQMYTTLLQPQTFAMARPGLQRNVNAQSRSLFHHLFEPIRNAVDRGEVLASSPLASAERSSYRVVAVRASAESLGLEADGEQNGNGL